MVVEATASYHWFVELVEPLAEKVVLANPNKLRVIAESTKKTDRLDAYVLAEFLARDMVPRGLHAHAQAASASGVGASPPLHPGPDDRRPVQDPKDPGDYNADRRDLFSANCGLAYIKQVPLSDADRLRDQPTVVGLPDTTTSC